MIPTIVVIGLAICLLLLKWGGCTEDCDRNQREQFRKEKEDAEK